MLFVYKTYTCVTKKEPFLLDQFWKDLQLRVTQIKYTDSHITDCKDICFSLVKRCIYNFPQSLKPFDCKCIESTDIRVSNVAIDKDQIHLQSGFWQFPGFAIEMQVDAECGNG